METAKLTLRLPRRVVDAARRMASESGMSVTQLFSAFILTRYAQRNIPIGPITRSVTGILKVSEGWDYRQDLEEALSRHYDLTK